jgi:predicted GIY-YIG superfamily endonuclease
MAQYSYVYMLQSIFDPERHYVGLTDDLQARLQTHNKGSVQHSRQFRPWRIKTVVAFADRIRAAEFERYLKTGSGRAFAKKHF